MLLSGILSGILIIWIVVGVIVLAGAPTILSSPGVRLTIGIAIIALVTLIIIAITGWDPAIF